MYIDGIDLCIACMKPLKHLQRCDECGFQQESYQTIPKYLFPGTILRERYVLGKVIGEGSFGITYIGWDKLLETQVAVKEYFPVDHVNRSVIPGSNTEVHVFEGKEKEEYEKQLEKYLNEAKRLSRFNHLQGVVSICDFFHENNTAYIVMEYVDGISVKKYVEENGRIDGKQVLELMAPVMDSLLEIHKTGLIHRDISPDNILLTKAGELVLIDFGSARNTNFNSDKSLTIVFKRGFSPEEQYRSRGMQGVWSDIYALCATIYYMLMGKAPLEALERIFEDEMPSIVDIPNINLSVKQKRVIMKGISVRAEERYQDISELKEALYHGDDEKKCLKLRWWQGTLILLSAISIVAALGYWGKYCGNNEASTVGVSEQPVSASPIAVSVETEDVEEKEPKLEKIKIPNVVGMKYKKAKRKLKKAGFQVEVKWKRNNVSRGTVLKQSQKQGWKVLKSSKILLTVSKGEKIQTVVPSPTASSVKKPSAPAFDGAIN